MSTALGYRAAGYGADHGIGRGMAMGARLVNVNSRFLDCFVWTASGCIGGSADGTMAGVLADGDAPTPNVAPWTVCASAGSVSQAAPPRVAQVAGPPEGCDAPPPPVLPPLLPLPAAAPPPDGGSGTPWWRWSQSSHLQLADKTTQTGFQYCH